LGAFWLLVEFSGFFRLEFFIVRIMYILESGLRRENLARSADLGLMADRFSFNVPSESS
jgi:hypothetical protein